MICILYLIKPKITALFRLNHVFFSDKIFQSVHVIYSHIKHKQAVRRYDVHWHCFVLPHYIGKHFFSCMKCVMQSTHSNRPHIVLFMKNIKNERTKKIRWLGHFRRNHCTWFVMLFFFLFNAIVSWQYRM